jgi:hypothetical protein
MHDWCIRSSHPEHCNRANTAEMLADNALAVAIVADIAVAAAGATANTLWREWE